MSATALIINLLGAVALLLWGIRMVRTGVERAFGGSLKTVLGRALGNRLKAFAAGLGVTVVLQSSTATCLLATSFVDRALVAGAAALAVMLGADVGTAVAAQVLSLKVAWMAPLLVFVGFVLFQRSEGRRWKSLGRTVIGLGLVFLALSMIVDDAAPIRQSPLVLQVVEALGREPAIALILAALLTWVAHSSLATVLFVASLTATGSLSLHLSLILVLGANLGGAAPALAATWQASPAARRVALGNAFFKLSTCLGALALLSPAAELLSALDGEPARQVMVAHLAFNLVLAAVFLPVVGLVADLLTRLVPDGPAPREDAPETPRYLAASDLGDPGLALANAARETLRMGDIADRMLAGIGTLLKKGDRMTAEAVTGMDDALDALCAGIKVYLTEVRREPLEPVESRRCSDIMDFATNLEHVGDIIDKNLLDAATKRVKRELSFSEAGQAELDNILSQVRDSLRLALNVFMSGEHAQARTLMERKDMFRDLERNAQDQHYERLRQGVAASMETSALHLDILRDLKQIHSHLASVAYPILRESGDLRPTRLRDAGVLGEARGQGA